MDMTKNNIACTKKSITNKILSIVFMMFLFPLLWQCTSKVESSSISIPKNYSIVDYGGIGFATPSDTALSKYLTTVFNSVDSSFIYVTKIKSKNDSIFLFSIYKMLISTEEAAPMEIVFIEDILKYNGQYAEGESQLLNYGIYDKNKKRLRYKIVRLPIKGLYKTLYYFMRNDYSKYYYELSIVSHLNNFLVADSIITQIAESFIFL